MVALRSVKHCYKGPETALLSSIVPLLLPKAMTTIPTIHTNGTGKDTLTAEYYAAYKAIKESINTLLDATLNGRDYYPQGSDAFYQAREERQDALSKLHQVKIYIEEVITGIAEQS
jgi:hypothetical protein